MQIKGLIDMWKDSFGLDFNMYSQARAWERGKARAWERGKT